MCKSLQEVRETREHKLKSIIEIPIFVGNDHPKDLYRLIVILKDENMGYHLHRYFSIVKQINDKEFETEWHVSVDVQRQTPDRIFQTIEEMYPEGLKTNII